MKRNENCFGCHELPVKIVHKGVFKSTKICLTCNIARPFRSNHCSDCDNCTLRFDHHCPWIGGCVGKRNYIYFFVFLILLNIKNFYLLIFSIIHIFKEVILSESKDGKNVAQKLIKVIPSLFTIILIAATMTFTTGLIIYHIKLILYNVTTKEEIKKLIPIKIGNSYDRGKAKNCIEFWTRHKSMENNYTVKDLRLKGKPEKKKTPLVSTKKFRPKIMPFSEKEKFLKNKAKKEKKDSKSIEERFYSQNSDKNSKNDGSGDENTKSINSDNKSNSYSENENINNNKNDNKTKNKITKRNKNNEKNNSKTEKKIFKDSSSNSKKSSNKQSSNSSEYNNRNEVDDFSDVDISDENDISNRKICNTSIKNSNLNNNVINKMNILNNNKIRIKTYMNEKKFNFNDDDNDLNYKIAQQRLEELSSEITIHEEINQLGSSLSIPKENSFNSSLSQKE